MRKVDDPGRHISGLCLLLVLGQEYTLENYVGACSRLPSTSGTPIVTFCREIGVDVTLWG